MVAMVAAAAPVFSSFFWGGRGGDYCSCEFHGHHGHNN